MKNKKILLIMPKHPATKLGQWVAKASMKSLTLKTKLDIAVHHEHGDKRFLPTSVVWPCVANVIVGKVGPGTLYTPPSGNPSKSKTVQVETLNVKG